MLSEEHEQITSHRRSPEDEQQLGSTGCGVGRLGAPADHRRACDGAGGWVGKAGKGQSQERI